MLEKSSVWVETAQRPVLPQEIRLWQKQLKSTQKQKSNFSFPVKFTEFFYFA